MKNYIKNLKGDIFGGIISSIVALPQALAFGVATGKLGFTIFNYETLQSEFVDISPYAISENERIVDIKRLDLNHLLLLTENQLIVYDILKGTITLQLKCDDTLGTVFHIWIN